MILIYYCEKYHLFYGLPVNHPTFVFNVLVYELIAALFVSLSIQIKRIKFPTFNNQDAHCNIYTSTISTHQRKKKWKLDLYMYYVDER